MNELVTHTLEPIYTSQSKVLILGTMPSPKSREIGFYYSHPQNRFWRVLSTILNEPIPNTTEQKIEMLNNNHIALWDVLQSCEITGADDNSIRNPAANDINQIRKEAKIKAIFTTGKKATQLYQKLCLHDTNMPSVYLPSTSPANCKNCTIETLTEAYGVILNYLI
ncbi:DNA-deoxyinosine glycosylase [Paludicola sp. MB14-C6]|uniref:DNA-deoxyinosine glycosylase n=1 Tax=Paludihabitans sp. MB14-C6 TaxID=3070656 RepID=UPI0027DB5A21|nr:DNA-deoxyinosine glycosylase [Paludicola sp. MB14-C6]WMJ23314.1 DNA-deoxyinosine glycosylase [Paludicola sp. MB14-C6]